LLSGIYRGVWQYVGIRDIYRYALAVIGAVLSTALIASWVYHPLEISLRIFVIFAILLFLGLAITRSSFKLLDQIYNQQLRDQKQENRVLIYGADNAGIMILQWLTEDASQGLKPVGFLDRDPYKRGRQILGITVLGGIQDLEIILERTKAEGIILSSDAILKTDQLRQLANDCQTRGVWIKKLKIELIPVID
jgi:FlaA1/EpsC-like NDP-sugar epimerase